MTIQSILETLPEQAKRSVLYSLVGSINASLVGTAQSVVARLERDDYDVMELSPQDVEVLLTEADERTELLTNARRLARVGMTLRDALIYVANDGRQGAISATLDYMTRADNTRTLDENLLFRTMEAAGITMSADDVKSINALNTLNQVRRAENLAKQRGSVEWIIDQVFVPPTTSEIMYEDQEHEDGTMFGVPIETLHDVDVQLEELPEDIRERLFAKVLTALNKARDVAILGVMQSDRRYSFADLPIIAAAINDISGVDVKVSRPVTKSKTKH